MAGQCHLQRLKSQFGTNDALNSECWYGNSLPATIHAASSGCDITCNGNVSEACGFYENLQYTPPAQQNPGVGDFHLVGCYSDSTDFRDLPFSLIDYEGMTVENCVQAAAGYRYAAVEYYGTSTSNYSEQRRTAS